MCDQAAGHFDKEECAAENACYFEFAHNFVVYGVRWSHRFTAVVEDMSDQSGLFVVISNFDVEERSSVVVKIRTGVCVCYLPAGEMIGRRGHDGKEKMRVLVEIYTRRALFGLWKR